MSHTTKINDTIFIHNGSYEGKVEIVIEEEVRKESIYVEFDDLKEFIANYVCAKKIAKLELAEVDEILGLK